MRQVPHTMTPTDVTLLKDAFRARFKAYRQQLDAPTYEALSESVCTRLLALPELQAADVIHCYWPLVHQREVDTRPLIQALHAQGKTVGLPVVADGPATRSRRPEMQHYVFQGTRHLRPGRWGVYEPTGPETVPPDAFEAVIVPALGLDRRGYRLGYGKGYYDTFLKPLPACKIGLVYDACLVDALPTEPHDVPLDVLVTEKEIYRL